MAYPLEGVTALDDFDGNISSSLVATYQQVGDATNGISFDEEGNYTITISSTDQAGSARDYNVFIVPYKVIGIKMYTNGVLVVGMSEVEDINNVVNKSHSELSGE